ncbi:sensory transduction histidine kinase [Fusarium phyllophilum]|uniref:Sensory transduction histidine kinase n=1 Tax=Fusarium phyllophilum TaxID=47803 RepID=A0A8H5JWL1_9HYPO|nr:sensory transduction histidine kinase [Fusarium phyllophilum]
MPPPALQHLGLIDLVASDPRPTFVVALPEQTSSKISHHSADILYRNPALQNSYTLDHSIASIPQDVSHSPFWNWVTNPPSAPTSHTDAAGPAPTNTQHSLPYLGVYWTRSIVLGQWVVMSGNETPPSSEPPRKVRIEGKEGETTRRYPQKSPLDNARLPSRKKSESKTPLHYRDESNTGLMIPVSDSEAEPFLDVVQNVDWESTSLGPMSDWPAQLQHTFNQLVSDSRPVALYWGPEYVTIYNEAFSKYCGARHPGLLGRPAPEAWPHLKTRLDEMTASPSKNYSNAEDESKFFIPLADGSHEETYVKSSMVPIVSDKKCLGIQHSLLEMTSRRLWERRMKMLIDLGEALVSTKDAKSYWSRTIEELERWSPTYDVPLAFLYSVADDESGTTLSKYDCPKICHLEGSLGVPEGHAIAPQVLNLRETDEGMASVMRKSLDHRQPILLQTKDDTLPKRLLHGLAWRGFGDPCQAAIVLPIRPTKEENAMGILFLGLNPRRPYDNDYRQFISLLSQKLTSSLASTVLLEEEARRRRNITEQAAYDNAMLTQRLEYQTKQTERSMQTFTAVADFIPVGMCFVDVEGNITFANDAWHRITGCPRGPIVQSALLESVLEEDKQKVIQAYKDVQKVDTVTFEYRIARNDNTADSKNFKPSTSPLYSNSERVLRHILASTKAERALDGSVIRILTCLTDVTVQKDTAEEAVRRAQEAENLKRLAEFATVGMYDVSMDGRLLSANNLFWELTDLEKVDLTKTDVRPWPECVVKEDLHILQESLDKLVVSGRTETAEFRLRNGMVTEDSNGNSAVAPRWVLATFMPVRSSDGVIQSFTGCLSDVSIQKWQLEQEKLRKEEAIESKRQQENFIDMTSHEMRNPLSAILHCTDAIIASLARVQDISDNSAPLTPTRSGSQGDERSVGERSVEEKKLLEDSIENAETIVTCAQHQKRIVDDILTMSKLDSKLLAVTPCTVDPIQIVNGALKMFEVEARRVDIELTSYVDKSYKDLAYDYLDLDPSRVQQVLINLLTNALKFTKTGTTRHVTVGVKGSLEPPGEDMTVVQFIPRFCDVSDEYDQPALKGRTRPVYLLFEVKDTGQGLTVEEMGSLFNKFVQASAKTHTKYGGSGLGLFISRRLTELQNGAIGVSSQPGVGSTFAFYIEAFVPSEASRNEALAAAAAARLNTGADGTEADGKRPCRDIRLQKHQNPRGNVRLDGILVVEDNLINQQITRRGLTDRGYMVDVANHGIEALDKLKRRQGGAPGLGLKAGSSRSGRSNMNPLPIAINLVLMDIEMPIQDGLTCTRIIRELEAEGEIFCASGGRIPIIAVTANARPEQVMEAKQAGCDDVMVKPYRIPELIEKMQVVVRRMGGLSPDSPVR